LALSYAQAHAAYGQAHAGAIVTRFVNCCKHVVYVEVKSAGHRVYGYGFHGFMNMVKTICNVHGEMDLVCASQ
jgi:hypothetical protein